MENYILKNNKEQKQYELEVEGFKAKIEYIEAKGNIYLTHTEVPKELGGKGIASIMVQKALEEVEKRNLKLFPLCPFVAAYIKKNHEWGRILANGVNIGS